MGICQACKTSRRIRTIRDCGKSSSYTYTCHLSLMLHKAGDFNSIPTSLPMTVIRDHAALMDAWDASHSTVSSSSSVDMTSAREMITHFGITADSPVNSYSAGKQLEPHARKFLGKRLDYIFYRQPSRRSIDKYSPVLSCSDTKVVFTDLVPGHKFSFSDHFGLEATLDIHIPHSDTEYSANLQLQSQTTSHLTSTSIEATIQSLTSCHHFSGHRSSRELIIFGLCIFLLICLIIGSAWLPQSWNNSIFVLFTVFIAWLATTMLYEGFLYGRWEANALLNIIEELEIHRDNLDRNHMRPSGRRELK
jgi:sphingomyelin phosphodiesterase 2